jgi:hypothetical protein
MMKDKNSMHQLVQYMCDCFATTDPLQEMVQLSEKPDVGDSAAKWIALAVLHGINNNAEKISLFQSKDGDISVKAAYREASLPNPGAEVGDKIIQAIKEITHIHDKKGRLPLALGIRDSSIDLEIKIKSKEKGNRITIKFPE